MKKYLPLFLILIIILSTNYVTAQQNKLQYNKWIKNWHLLGVIPLQEGVNEVKHLGGFENDILALHGGVSNLQVTTGQIEKFDDLTFTWIVIYN